MSGEGVAFKLKNFMDPIEVVKKHGFLKICVFFHCSVSEFLEATVLELSLIALL